MIRELSIQNILFTILIGISSYFVSEFKNFGEKVEDLNNTIVKVVTMMGYHEERIKENKIKIEKIESKLLK